jgi:hypothetical protein
MTSPLVFFTTVPSGTSTMRSLAVGAVSQVALADPAVIGTHVRTVVQGKQGRGLAVDTEDDVPPLPPSAPSGPPSGLNFSRLIEAHPFPPAPAAR